MQGRIGEESGKNEIIWIKELIIEELVEKMA